MRLNWVRTILGFSIGALLVAGPLLYARYRNTTYRNFRVVEDGKLYRSGQMTLPALQRTIEEYGIRTVISLRYAERDGDKPADWREEEFCLGHGVRYLRIRPREWHDLGDGYVPADQPVAEFLKIMDDRTNYPVLIHCFAGMHRTGSFCSIYRMEYQNWSNAEAMNELRALGYKNLDKEEDVQAYMDSYVPRSNKRP